MPFLHLDEYKSLIDNGGLIRTSYNSDRSLVTLKYTKKTYYKNLWNKYPLLLEARGHTFDTKTGNLVALPFKKIFNYRENRAGSDFNSDTKFIAVRKINGSMGCVSFYNGNFVFSTTGSNNKETSEFVNRLETLFFYSVNHIEYVKTILQDGFSLIFEVVHKDDPHIIKEIPGLYLIGARNHVNGDLLPEQTLDTIAKKIGGLRRPYFQTNQWTAKELLQYSVTVPDEGFIVQYSNDDPNDILALSQKAIPQFKMKSRHYLSRKFLARTKDLENAWKGQNRDEEVNMIINSLKKIYSLEDFEFLPEQERLEAIRKLDLIWS